MIVYAVRIEVDAAVADDYAAWLEGHLPEVLESDGFLRAELLLEAAPAPEGRRVFETLYYVESQAALDAYLRDRAPGLREDGLRRFPNRFTASRQVWAGVKSFPK